MLKAPGRLLGPIRLQGRARRSAMPLLLVHRKSPKSRRGSSPGLGRGGWEGGGGGPLPLQAIGPVHASNCNRPTQFCAEEVSCPIKAMRSFCTGGGGGSVSAVGSQPAPLNPALGERSCNHKLSSGESYMVRFAWLVITFTATAFEA